jgi:hypothetical protein
MTVYYGAGREQLDTADWSITTTASSGSLTATTLYFTLQARNRIGSTLFLKSGAIAISNNDKLTITINSSALASGEEWLYYVISVSTSNTDNTFIQLAKLYRLTYQSEYTIANSFPLSVEFTLDSQLAYQNTLANFPTSNLIDGQLVGLISTGYIYEYYENDTTTTVDSLTVFAATPSGRWRRRGSWYTQVLDVYLDGALQDIRLLDGTEIIEIPNFNFNGTSDSVNLWLLNDTNSIVDTSTRINFTVKVGEEFKTKLFDNHLIISLKGFVNVNTGALRTTYLVGGGAIPELGIDELYSYSASNIKLPDTLDTNEALSIDIKVSMEASEIQGYINHGSFIQILPQFSETSSVYSDVGTLFENGIILDEYDLRRIVPDEGLSAIALKGSGIVKNYIFQERPEQNITPFLSNTASQKVTINRLGNCAINTIVPSDAVIRAIVSTVSGESAASALTVYTAVSLNDTIVIDITYPTAIRSDYGDVIAGNSQGAFNPFQVYIYVQRQSDGEIRRFEFNTTNTPNQQFLITDFTAGTLFGGALPTTQFGLYDQANLAVLSTQGGGLNGADNYRVAYSYYYDGDQITDISHSVLDGCVAELTASLEEVFLSFTYWRITVPDKTALRAIDTSDFTESGAIYILLENSTPKLYSFFYGDAAADDNDKNIRPTTNNGVFKIVSSSSVYWADVVSTIVAIKALAVASLTEGEVRTVLENNASYVFRSVLPEADDGDLYLASDDGTTEGWVKMGGGISGLTATLTIYAAPAAVGTGDGTYGNSMAIADVVTYINETSDNGYKITVILADGTYPDVYTFKDSYDLYLLPASTNTIFTNELIFQRIHYLRLGNGFIYQNTLTFRNCDTVNLNNSTFNSTGIPIIKTYRSKLVLYATYTLSGTSKNSFIIAYDFSRIVLDSSEFVVSSGTCVWEYAFIDMFYTCIMDIFDEPISSNITGPRYILHGNASIITNGYNLNTLPGNSSGYYYDETSIFGFDAERINDGFTRFLLTNGDKGDITVSNSGATWTIDNQAITYAKIQNVSATDRLLGRLTAGAGVVEELTVGTTLAKTGTTLNVNVGTGANQIVQLDGTAKLPAVDGSQLTNLPGGGGHVIQDEGTPLTARTNLNFVGSLVAATDNGSTTTIVTINIPDGDKGDITVSATGSTWTIDNNAITTVKITDGNVTFAKIQDSSGESKLVGRGQGAGAGDFQEITLGTNLSMSGTTLNAGGAASFSNTYSGTGSLDTFTVTHNLGRNIASVFVLYTTTNEQVSGGVTITNNNELTVTLNTVSGTNNYLITVI